MAIDPTVLPGFVEVMEGKQRDLPSKLDIQYNYDQQPRFEQVRDNQQPIYDLQILVPTAWQRGFRIWCQRNAFTTPFTMPLRVEGGIIEQLVRWVVLPLDPRENKGYFIYPCSVQAAKLDDGVSDATEAEQDLFYEFMPYNNLWSKIINEDIPTI